MLGRAHVPIFNEIFAVDKFLQSPALLFGYQETHGIILPPIPEKTFRDYLRRIKRVLLPIIERWQVLTNQRHPDLSIPAEFRHDDMVQVLQQLGIEHVDTLDLFDPRATFQHDMNIPISDSWYGKYRTIIDIGSTEHVFDTKQCLENLFRMLQVGGHILLHLPCRGYFDHGMHTFSPECIRGALLENGFEIVYERYTTDNGFILPGPDRTDTLMWIIGKKIREVERFKCPEQGRWTATYQRNG